MDYCQLHLWTSQLLPSLVSSLELTRGCVSGTRQAADPPPLAHTLPHSNPARVTHRKRIFLCVCVCVCVSAHKSKSREQERYYL